MRQQPAWLNKSLFPFESKWAPIDDNELHYIDEGKGETILFVHGTPEWSFGFRDLVKELKKSYRCVAVDHLGFGLSDKPVNADYTCRAHADRLEKFIDKLQLKSITLVANDFGGAFALNYAIRHPENIKAISIFNTWMWSLKNDSHYSTPAKIMNSWLGKFLYLNLNFPVNVVMPSAYGDKSKLTEEVHRHYKMALPKNERTAAYAFSKELMNASDWWQSLWNRMDRIEKIPFLIFWGMKDKFVPPYELEKWRARLPNAEVIVFDDAGHFVQEEKPNEMNAALKKIMTAKVQLATTAL